MKTRILLVMGGALLAIAGYLAGSRSATVAYAGQPTQGSVPKSYGRIAAAVVNSEGTGLVFEDALGVIRFLTITGKKEGELTRE
jgi:hypothetical protein